MSQTLPSAYRQEEKSFGSRDLCDINVGFKGIWYIRDPCIINSHEIKKHMMQMRTSSFHIISDRKFLGLFVWNFQTTPIFLGIV